MTKQDLKNPTQAGMVDLVNHAGGNYFGFTLVRAIYTYFENKTLLAKALAKRTALYTKGREYKIIALLFGFVVALTLKQTGV